MQLIVLLGQTCSGKSRLAVDLAKCLGQAWIVNCDSRQVYKYLNIGTAKVEGRWQDYRELGEVFVYQDVPHFLIDFVEPVRRYSLVDYLDDWVSLFDKPGEFLPEYVILTGGTGLFAKAVVQQYQLPRVKPEFEAEFESLRENLSEFSLEELQKRVLEIENDELKTKSNSPLLRGMSPSGDRGLMVQTNTESVEFVDTIPPNPQQTILSASGPPENLETNAPIPPSPLERGGSTFELASSSNLPTLLATRLDRGEREIFNLTEDFQSSHKKMNQSDYNNPRRLVNRILEVEARENGWLSQDGLDYPQFEKTFQFSIQADQEFLFEKIKIRIDQRVESGLLDEVQGLQYLGTERFMQLGLEYRLSQLFLLGQLSEDEWKSGLYRENIRYAKRQLTWLKKQQVQWIASLEEMLGIINV